MNLPGELLDQADHLLTGPLGQGAGPSEADIRRAVSNAYYALFHFLVLEATTLLCPPDQPNLAARFRRAFAHSGMVKVCAAMSNQPPFLRALFRLPIDPDLIALAADFQTLQNDRHPADYDTGNPTNLLSARTSVKTARRAITRWNALRGTSNAKVFLTALAMHEKWQK